MDRDNGSSISSLLQILTAVLAETAQPEDFLRAMFERSVQRTGASRGVLVEIPADGPLVYRVLHRIRPRELDSNSGLYSRSVFAHVIETGRGLCIDDARRRPEFMHKESIARLGFASILCVPVRVGERIAALVHLEHDETGHFAPLHQDLMEWLAEIASPMLAALQAGTRMLSEHATLQAVTTTLQAETRESRKRFKAEWSFQRFAGRSDAVRKLEIEVGRAAAHAFPVLLYGETGTGKSILAAIVHARSPRAGGPFVTASCPLFAKGTMEAALFGTREGAFTDAKNTVGKVQMAEGGTLFLDEIGDLPLDLQPKLLRLLQEKTYEIVGDARERRADIRIVAATHRDLEQMVQSGAFRSDLYHRLDYLTIRIPPLRARREDIPVLLRNCLDRIEGGRWVQISEEAAEALREFDSLWPGNVRTVERLAVQAVVDKGPGVMTPADIERFLPGAHNGANRDREPEDFNLPRALETNERALLERVTAGYPHLSRAEQAAKLGIGESTYLRKLRQYDLLD